MKMNDMWGEPAATVCNNPGKSAFFRQSKYAMFIHWGLYSQAAGRWNGSNYYGISEWIMHCRKITPEQYETLASRFNPLGFNAAELVAKIKAYGMKYLVITAKHHDGFALFKSSHSFNIVDATPFKRDVIKELSNECALQGLGFGVYYSQFQDWHELNSWSNRKCAGDFEGYFYRKCLPQIRELLTGYGKLSMIWFDTPGMISAEQSQMIVDLVHELQPGAMINSRIGNGAGEYVTFGDQEIPPVNISGLWESIDTTNDSWGYNWYDTNYIEEKTILSRLIRTVARGGNYMLNTGLDDKGAIPFLADRFLKGAGKWLKHHEDAIYGAACSPWHVSQSWGDATQQGNRIYLFLFDYVPGMKIELYGLGPRIIKAKFHNKNISIPERDGNWITLVLPLEVAAESVEVVELELAEPANEISGLNVSGNMTATLPVDTADCINCQVAKHSWMEKFGEWKHLTYARLEGADAALRWEFVLHMPGLYRVEVEYGNVRQRAWRIVSDEEKSIHFWSRNATDDNHTIRFRRSAEGIIRFQTAGTHSLTFKCEDELNFDGLPQTNAPSIDISAIRLIPLSNGMMQDSI